MSQKTPPLLLETIKVDKGQVENLFYHQQRCNRSRQILFDSQDTLDLSLHIKAPSKNLYRCRILYGETLHSIEYIPYVPKEIDAIKIVPSDIIYNLKYANRDALNTLLSTYPEVDEIIIEKDGYLSDTTIANIAFYNGKQWITPKNPLLEGTMRAKLIEEGFLHTEDICKTDLPKYTHLALINAMIGFKILNINIIK